MNIEAQLPISNLTVDDIEENTLYVEVSYDKLRYTKNSQIQKKTLSDVFSSLCGSMGITI